MVHYYFLIQFPLSSSLSSEVKPDKRCDLSTWLIFARHTIQPALECIEKFMYLGEWVCLSGRRTQTNTARRALWGKDKKKIKIKIKEKKEKSICTSLMGGCTENSGLFC